MLRTVDVLVLTDHFYIVNIIQLYYKTSYNNEEVNCTEPSPLLVFLGFAIK